MEGSAHNWLSFSLSHHHGLFEAFSTPSHPPLHVGGEEGGGEEPKLADFLGGGGGGGAPPLAAEEEMSCGGEGELGSIAAGFLRGFAAAEQPTSAAAAAAEPRRASEESTFGQRTSIYRGVTRHRWTGRYEAHLWDNSCRREGQSRKGRQVYLGGYDKEEKAARAYDLAALKYWGPNATTNFPVSNYEKELEEMKTMTRQEFVASLRRKSSGFSRGASIYRGVTRHHQHGRWQARIGRVAGNKDLYLGTFSTQEEAAEAYDIAAIKFRGLNAVTNFDMNRYDVEAILNSDLPIGSLSSKASKASSDASSMMTSASELRPGRGVDAAPAGQGGQDYWSLLARHYHQQELYSASSGFEVFGSGVNVDFSAGGGGGNSNGGGVMWSGVGGGAVMAHQVHDNRGSSSSSSSTGACSNIPYATPIVMGGGYDQGSNSNVGGWGSTAPSYFYNYQGATSNASALHTALYGME